MFIAVALGRNVEQQALKSQHQFRTTALTQEIKQLQEDSRIQVLSFYPVCLSVCHNSFIFRFLTSLENLTIKENGLNEPAGQLCVHSDLSSSLLT